MVVRGMSSRLVVTSPIYAHELTGSREYPGRERHYRKREHRDHDADGYGSGGQACTALTGARDLAMRDETEHDSHQRQENCGDDRRDCERVGGPLER